MMFSLELQGLMIEYARELKLKQNHGDACEHVRVPNVADHYLGIVVKACAVTSSVI